MTDIGFYNLEAPEEPGLSDSVDILNIAENVQTPFYLYSAGQLDKQLGQIKEAFQAHLPVDRQPLIAYACKANAHMAILSHLAKQGCGADIVSGGEMQKSLKAGIPASKIVYSGVGKSEEELKDAIQAGIRQINVESSAEFEKIAVLSREMQREAHVAFRLNPNVDAKTHAKITTGKSENKFGLPANRIFELYKKADSEPFVTAVGLSMHIGSQITQTKPFEDAFGVLADFVGDLRKAGLTVSSLDLGGGFGIRYKPDDKPLDTHAYAKLVAEKIVPLDTDLIIEPGRFIAAPSGILVTKVLYIKDEGGKKFAILDAGMNDLIRPTLYDAYHPVWLLDEHATQRPKETYDLVGPVCETGDIFAKDYKISQLKPNDLLAIGCAGGYGMVMASTYNVRPLPTEVLTKEGQYSVIHKSRPIDALIADETIPDWV